MNGTYGLLGVANTANSNGSGDMEVKVQSSLYGRKEYLLGTGRMVTEYGIYEQ